VASSPPLRSVPSGIPHPGDIPDAADPVGRVGSADDEARSFAPLYLAGQTGSGKSVVAMALAELVPPAEIVNADAYQIYSGLETLCAGPAQEERARVPHHLYGLLPPTESCDAARFADLARRAIAEVGERALPIVVGGSGLYLKAVTHGLAPVPKGDPDLRARLDTETLEALVARYRELDPEGASRTNLKNRRYVARNLEITLLAGRPASELKAAWERERPPIRAAYLQRPRETVYRRIDRRARDMLEQGAPEEVARAAALGLSPTAAKAIGVEEILALLRGDLDEDGCLEAIRRRTRRYAKRQETWFRREPAFLPFPVADEETPDATARRIAERFGMRPRQRQEKE